MGKKLLTVFTTGFLMFGMVDLANSDSMAHKGETFGKGLLPNGLEVSFLGYDESSVVIVSSEKVVEIQKKLSEKNNTKVYVPLDTMVDTEE